MINYPQQLDNFEKPHADSRVDDIDHAQQHRDANTAIEALQVKVGIENDSNTDAHEYKLSSLTDGDKAASKQDQTNHNTNTSNPHNVTAGQIGTYTSSQIDTQFAQKTQVLEKGGTAVFEPSSDYDPATKKYVDELTGVNTKQLIQTFSAHEYVQEYSIVHIDPATKKVRMSHPLVTPNISSPILEYVAMTPISSTEFILVTEGRSVQSHYQSVANMKVFKGVVNGFSISFEELGQLDIKARQAMKIYKKGNDFFVYNTAGNGSAISVMSGQIFTYDGVSFTKGSYTNLSISNSYNNWGVDALIIGNYLYFSYGSAWYRWDSNTSNSPQTTSAPTGTTEADAVSNISGLQSNLPVIPYADYANGLRIKEFPATSFFTNIPSVVKNEFIGIAQNTANQNEEVEVMVSGISEIQPGLVYSNQDVQAGLYYYMNNGLRSCAYTYAQREFKGVGVNQILI